MKNRSVSVCMASYNGEQHILEQIQSILSQLDLNDELIISDDNSTDNTVDIIKEFNDNRIKIIENNTNIGYTGNFERALREVKNEIVFLSDQDDVWLDNKVKTVIKYLDKYDFVVSDAKIVDNNLSVINVSHFNVHNVKNGFINNFIKSRYLGCLMAFRREVIEMALPFPRRHNICLHDTWILNVAGMYFKTGLIPAQLVLYRRHNNNVSLGGFGKGSSIFKKIVSRLYILLNLFLIFKKRVRKNRI